MFISIISNKIKSDNNNVWLNNNNLKCFANIIENPKSVTLNDFLYTYYEFSSNAWTYKLQIYDRLVSS